MTLLPVTALFCMPGAIASTILLLLVQLVFHVISQCVSHEKLLEKERKK